MGRFACFLILAAVAASACGDQPGHITADNTVQSPAPAAGNACPAGQPPVTAANTCGLPTGCSVRAWLDETGCALRYDTTCPCRLNPDAHCADPDHSIAMVRYVIPLTWSGGVGTGIEHPIDLVYPTNPPDPTDRCVYTVTLQ